jgi:diguanylate cyclase (GGDEF)-like protein
MNQASGVREMRVLVNAYNGLLNRRNKLESILRSAAETDALTGLPNRYSLERYALEAEENAGGSMAVLMFDVNYLKQVNDTQGHPAGDKLIRTTGDCILECFDTGNNNCYRLGGDEFAAVLRDCSEEDVRTRLTRFDLVLEREKISVSVGYAYAARTDEESFKKLFNEADKRMYEKKKQVHESDRRTLS